MTNKTLQAGKRQKNELIVAIAEKENVRICTTSIVF